MATSFASLPQQTRQSPITTPKRGDQRTDFNMLLTSQLPERTMTSLRGSGTFETPPRQQAGSSLSGFQSPYTPPSQIQRVPPAPSFATPQRQSSTTQTPSSLQRQTSTSGVVADGIARPPDTPKVGGKWIHPALKGIDREARKFMFGEEELKKLVVNAVLLYSMWSISHKLEESDTFEGVVRYIRHSPRVALGLQIFSWTFRALFIFNIVMSILPLIRPRSRPLTTIPLTPAQRELIGLDRSDITPIATTIVDTITPPRYKASPSGSRLSPRLTPSRQESPRSVSVGTPSPAQKQFGASTASSFGTYSSPIQPRPRSSSALTGRKFASGVGGSPLGVSGSPLSSGTGLLESPASRKASMEVFFRG